MFGLDILLWLLHEYLNYCAWNLVHSTLDVQHLLDAGRSLDNFACPAGNSIDYFFYFDSYFEFWQIWIIFLT